MEKAATVLVVDDDPFTAELTGMILEASGFETIIAEGGVDALEKMAPSVGIVVSDMNMPFIDGIQLHAELREQGYAQPFILLTGEESSAVKAAHPQIEIVMTKDENLQESLPQLVGTLIGGP